MGPGLLPVGPVSGLLHRGVRCGKVQDAGPPMSLVGMHLSGMRLLRARISYGVPPTMCLSHRHVSHRRASHRRASHGRASRRRACSVLSHKTYIEYSRRIVIIECNFFDNAKDDMLGREIGVPTLAPGRASNGCDGDTLVRGGNSAASDRPGPNLKQRVAVMDSFSKGNAVRPRLCWRRTGCTLLIKTHSGRAE
jgi:hypothetical protein